MPVLASKSPAVKSPTKVKKPRVPKKPTTYIANVVDTSGSMTGLIKQMVHGINEINSGIKLASINEGLKTSLSMYTFDTTVETSFENISINEIPAIDGLKTGGYTAIFDAIDYAVRRLSEFSKLTKCKKDAFLVNIFTDGHENGSKCKISEIVSLMSELADKGTWTFTFQVPVGHKRTFCASYNIPEGNVREWEQTVEGTRTLAVEAVAATSVYMDARSKGKTQTSSFYTDLSKVTQTKVKRTLDDISSKFRVISVDKEAAIKDFIELKTKKPYVIGSCYYKLSKPEVVQAQKAVLLVPVNTKTVYGGDEARELIGLTPGASVKVIPGNHGQFDVYVQSTSVNRKLVRGTKLLLDKDTTVGTKSTWDHDAAKAAADRKKAALA